MEAPPLKNLMVIVIFVSLFILLVGTMPGEFAVLSDEYTQVDYPDVFQRIDLTMYADTANFTVGDSGGVYVWNDFGHDCRLIYAGGPYDEIYNNHFYGFWGFDTMEWRNQQGVSRGDYLTIAEITTDYDATVDHAFYTVKSDGDPSWVMDAFIGYNTTLYSSVTDAWNNDALYILFAIDFDEIGTNWNAWTLISQLLLFQTPNVHVIINALIAIPIWVGIAWLTFTFIKAVIDSLPFT